MIFLYNFYKLEHRPAVLLMVVDYVDAHVVDLVLVLNTVIIVLNIIISILFLIKLRKFYNFLDRSAKLANTIVFYQILLSAIFWCSLLEEAWRSEDGTRKRKWNGICFLRLLRDSSIADSNLTVVNMDLLVYILLLSL
ncbi:hypothetical protein QR680_013939 [Steinernema hermaphroditum]|uniref:Uncharacterized protein n=1 Tax=Steinernema hermaphroditum TaxID=289476 RepID=A0AA39M330_9BILA|nr:hypothetical protein QR680_013939 [Steinernema hermaphroditum]